MPKIEVVHATSPLCQWSWGFEPVINRLEMVYGKQIAVTVGHGIPYVDRQQWLVDYDMTPEEAIAFGREIRDAGGLPMRIPESWDEMPASCLPASVAAKAAGIVHGERAERKLTRRLMHATFIEGRDTSDENVLVDVIRETGLDLDAMLKASGDDATRALEEDAHRLGHGANFFSLIVRDGKGTSITLERAYDPARVEAAIDFLAGKKLKKSKPKDIVAYVEEHGPVPAAEVARVFALPAAKAKATLVAAEKDGDLARVAYPGLEKSPFWRVA